MEGDKETMELDDFEVSSGTLILSDPCYERGIWCAEEVPARMGKWHGYAEVSDEGAWGKRVSRLVAYSDDVDDEEGADVASYELGVDSGQMSIVDSAYYGGGSGSGWYMSVCDVTNPYAGSIYGGIASSSGYGDGGYGAYVTMQGDEAVRVEIVFIEDEDEDDGE